MSQPRISGKDIWKRHEERVLELLLLALAILKNKINLVETEIGLNRELYFCLLEANRKQWARGKGFDYPPVGEGKNPPSPDDGQRATREDKIPDFTWSIIDHAELDPRRSARHFVIECKRLGQKPRSDWILNENYIQHGIKRFITEEHWYAKGEKTAAMVGYVQSMDFDNILKEVNNAAHKASIPLLPAPTAWQKQGVNLLEHLLTRPFLPSPMLLKHFWVDLRACYTSSSPSSPSRVMQQLSNVKSETLPPTEADFNSD